MHFKLTCGGQLSPDKTLLKVTSVGSICCSAMQLKSLSTSRQRPLLAKIKLLKVRPLGARWLR